ncbi:hypothetical protein Q5P01_002898 [Channa striata]|uniref:G-protein coupled receptors family 1 profile domain-containing protein n=1 Tax=Channa striata TaxID=64152 RepID=A0AA88NQ67_CHASR|nr:hypothetical protein Q5P01_002898 [Channa striata]
MSVNSSTHHLTMDCLESRAASVIFTSVLMTNILILFPLLVCVFYLGLQRWRKQRSGSAVSLMTHSDFFTYNMAALEVISIFGSCLYCFGFYVDGLQQFGKSFFYITSPAQSLFPLFTCVERYLAVVHPITYMRLRQAGGVKIRNISTGCAWLLCLLNLCLSKFLGSSYLTVTNSCIMVFTLIAISFCSLSVLRVLKHPGPGEVSRDRERVDLLKQRAFHTIVAIMVAQLFRSVGILVCSVTFDSSVQSETNCVVGSSSIWLIVPCSLVLPVLFLQRAGKLPDCKHKTGSV